jgi:hypothetical protein
MNSFRQDSRLIRSTQYSFDVFRCVFMRPMQSYCSAFICTITAQTCLRYAGSTSLTALDFISFHLRCYGISLREYRTWGPLSSIYVTFTSVRRSRVNITRIANSTNAAGSSCPLSPPVFSNITRAGNNSPSILRPHDLYIGPIVFQLLPRLQLINITTRYRAFGRLP